MAGGIYVDRPFYFNPKCVLFSGILMLGYWFLPIRNIFILPLLFIISYIALAWYDHYYECNTPLFSGSGYGISVIDSIFKPRRQYIHNTNTPAPPAKLINISEQNRIFKRNVYLFHLIIVTPLLLYIGIRGRRADGRVFPVLTGVGLLAGIFHMYKYLSL